MEGSKSKQYLTLGELIKILKIQGAKLKLLQSLRV